MKRYLIFGDSWSHHSFAKLDNFKEGKGNTDFQTMFKNQEQEAINYSVLGGSNQDILNKIQTVKIADGDVLVVFQTDPLRDVIERKKFQRLQNINFEQNSMTAVAESLLEEFYNKLSGLNLPILLVGGLSCLAHDLIPSNIFTLEKSWTELCKDGFKDCYFEWTDFTELARDHLQCNDNLDIIKQQIQAKNHVWQTSDSFAWCHPSDIGYEAMFNALQPVLPNIN